MPPLFALHRMKLLTLLLVSNFGLMLHLSAGDMKPLSVWDWLDIVGEGGSAMLLLIWIGLLLKSRPAGRVTDLLFAGLGCLFFSLLMDLADEFVRMPDSVSWDAWLESGPMPVGFILLTLGIYHWHREQLAISAQMRNRERLYREHLHFDTLTPLGGATYLKNQIEMSIKQAVTERQPLSLIMLDIDAFSVINRDYGQAEGDRVLQVITQLVLLNLREHDLLCRLAGDRFVIVLPNTLESQAAAIAHDLALSIKHLAYRTILQGERLALSATTVAVMARQEGAECLLERLNTRLAHAKQTSLFRSA
ncbi:GGDEF domain-containing protein [Ectothiorhodospira lacustris]|uniref:GGDEF domain-containing protein n=1 Tax=Ectothiorhodospira lacustris TaxID=2899127 RepID=UPI001EE841EC|nr:GGDEF domain-containing protein [Ectothiorhodospira lacustris]MCG5511137.1 GGDEF domain-containing protein [Ectothiorhodospira lacustris]MCG5522801.1 GGDEF domain-containing protein [Ectothiorhodospira lacustris]